MSQREDQLEVSLKDTRAVILTHLLGEDLSAIDLEEKLGINESAVRRHLDILEQQGYIEHFFEKAKRGRPKKLYTITSAGRGLFPEKTHFLFTLLAQRIKEDQGDESLEKLLSGVAEDFAENLVSENSDKTNEERLKELVDSLDEFGFYATASKKDEVYDIEYRNCVFGDVLQDFGTQLCEMHKQIINAAVSDADVTLEKSLAGGDNLCVHKVVLEE